ncbi:thiosulfate dehydrogenase [quinone] large subunit [Streptacidiphilus sp. MAP12-33]|uniref:Rieske (2Fe-2S) protein n=1 Tax=Streptacidiphilus sp. MAP12-33 TaxID=3156266 RepID=UPI003515CBA8
MTMTISSETLRRQALLPLRLFLGVTFCYAGLLKLGDPHYLAGAADPASYLSQLQAALAAHSPAAPLLRLARHAPAATGTALAFGELAVGLGTLLGLFGRVAAAGGAALSLMLFLTVSWRTNPYFLGNDLPYLVAWIPLVLAGTPALSLDSWLAARRAAQPAPVPGRRRALLETAAAVLAVAGGGLLAGALTARSRKPVAAPASPVTLPGGGSGDAAGATPGASVAVAKVPVGGAVQLSAPGSGDPIFVVQPKPGTFCAFSGACTHAGCTVLPPKDGAFVCPCHDSAFDAATGAVLRGPATQALPRYAVTQAGATLRVAAKPE